MHILDFVLAFRFFSLAAVQSWFWITISSRTNVQIKSNFPGSWKILIKSDVDQNLFLSEIWTLFTINFSLSVDL